jgi:hypothetical protein
LSKFLEFFAENSKAWHMDNQRFKTQYNKAVDLHRRGQTAQALSAVDSLLNSADDDDQRIACINEKIHLLDHLGRRDEVLRLGAELASILPRSPKSKALYHFFGARAEGTSGGRCNFGVSQILNLHMSFVRPSGGMTEPLDNDFIVTDVIVDQVGIRRQEHAPYAGNTCLSADEALQLKQGYHSPQPRLNMSRPLRGSLGDISKRFFDLLERAFLIAQLH